MVRFSDYKRFNLKWSFYCQHDSLKQRKIASYSNFFVESNLFCESSFQFVLIKNNLISFLSESFMRTRWKVGPPVKTSRLN